MVRSLPRSKARSAHRGGAPPSLTASRLGAAAFIHLAELEVLGLERLRDFGLPVPRLLLLRGGRRRGDGRDRCQAVQYLPDVKFPHGLRRRRSPLPRPRRRRAVTAAPPAPQAADETPPGRLVYGRPAIRGAALSAAGKRFSSSAGRAARRQSGSAEALLIGARGLGDGD